MAGHARVSQGAEPLDLERRAFLDLLRMANTMAGPVAIAQQLTVVARYLSGCEAVAIRLKAGPGYPYAASLGFPGWFLALEDDLCLRDEAGRLLRDEQRRPRLACLCGRVLSGDLDRSQPFFSARGSFITASSRSIPAASAQPLGPMRNWCPAAGYETMGLFPIRRDGVTYGLIQCDDTRPDRLTAGAVDLMENLAATAAHLLQLAMA